jgi:hypothetical protein
MTISMSKIKKAVKKVYPINIFALKFVYFPLGTKGKE